MSGKLQPSVGVSRPRSLAARIASATPSDLPAITALLEAADLPSDDIAPHIAHFLVVRDEQGSIIGAVGAEVHAPDALLRSLVVAEPHRGAGIGDALVRRLEEVAAGWGVERWWLLTTTAEKFFAERGFAVTSREQAPAAIRGTGQFNGGCCCSAVCMTRELRTERIEAMNDVRNNLPDLEHAQVERATRPEDGPSPGSSLRNQSLEPARPRAGETESEIASAAPNFDRAVTEFTARLRAFIRRRVRDDPTADDLTQETLLKVYRSRGALRDGQRIEAWLYRIARTTLIDHYRRAKPTEELPAMLSSEPPDELGQFRESVMTATRRFLEELPELYREPVRLAELEGLPLAKIALRSGLSLTAVKSRVQRGRALLKKKLQDCCRFEFDRHGKVIGWESRATARCCGPAARKR